MRDRRRYVARTRPPGARGRRDASVSTGQADGLLALLCERSSPSRDCRRGFDEREAVQHRALKGGGACWDVSEIPARRDIIDAEEGGTFSSRDNLHTRGASRQREPGDVVRVLQPGTSASGQM